MPYNANDAYLETRVLAADGLELVRLMYEAAIAAVRDARRCLAASEIAARSRAITKARRILIELTVSLDHERGGELSRGLARLYDYMSRKLIEANSRQADPPLEEVLQLLSTLLEGWSGIRPAQAAEAQPERPQIERHWTDPMAAAPASELHGSESHAWSF